MLEREGLALAHPGSEQISWISGVDQHVHVRPAVGESDHGARVTQQLGYPILVGVEYRIAEFHPQVVFECEIEKCVESVASALASDFGNCAPLERAQRGTGGLLDLHAFPTARKNSRPFKFVTEAVAK